MKEPKIYNLSDVIDFGKLHQGKKVIDVLGTNPSWLVWADGTISWFKLHGDVWTLGRLSRACDLERSRRNIGWGERPY